MWLAFYNQSVGDVLMLTRSKIDQAQVEIEKKADICLIKDGDSQEIVAINIFGVDDLNIKGQGSIQLNQDQVDLINQHFSQAGVEIAIEVDPSDKFVVGEVEDCQALEDSDHLSITKVNVGQDERLQIVCGAQNIRTGLKVLVAKVGAVMPSGLIIWPGQLRGVDSYGMICSTRELGLTDIEDLPGIWELDDTLAAGTGLDQVKAYYHA